VEVIGRNAIADGGRLEFGALLAKHLRQPADAEHAGMAFEQPTAENLEFAACHFLVGGFEQGAQRDQTADIFVDAVLHLDELGRSNALEFGPVGAALPAGNRIGGNGREQQADARRNPDGPVEPGPGCEHLPPLVDVFPTIVAGTSTAHLHPRAVRFRLNVNRLYSLC
jgi:hypothetical protein